MKLSVDDLVSELEDMREVYADRIDIDDNGGPNEAMRFDRVISRAIAMICYLKENNN